MKFSQRPRLHSTGDGESGALTADTVAGCFNHFAGPSVPVWGWTVTDVANTVALADANLALRKSSQTPRTSTEAKRGASRVLPRSISEIIGGIARERWPYATASELAIRAKKTQRQAEEWLAGGGMSSDALGNLIASDMGMDIIAAIVGEKNPTLQWFIDFQKSVKRAELKRKLQALQREIEEETE